MKKIIINKLAEEIREGRIRSRGFLRRRIKQLCRSYGLDSMPSYVEILNEADLNEFSDLLMTKPTRSASGVTAVAVMSRPLKCPHGTCYYCPKGNNAPQSYTGREPAAMRAINNSYDPYLQVFDRLNQLRSTGHNPCKVELIIMGGTFPSYDVSYQESFVKDCFSAMNDFPNKKPCSNKSLKILQDENQKSKVRCVALIFETRPDWCGVNEINRMLDYGCTRVELGVQSTDDLILEKVERQHDVACSVKATSLLKDCGLKVDYHMMLGLPGSCFDSDVKMMLDLFKDERFRPDGLKIYPCLVIKGTKLYDDFIKGIYKPVDDDYVIKVLKKVKPLIPEYVRIKRVMRDIPKHQIVAGPFKGNIRELVWKELEKPCRCIRCREAGHKKFRNDLKPELVVRSYKAGGGLEFFISYEDKMQDVLIGFLRLRIPKERIRPEITSKTALIRELHVFGAQAQLGIAGKFQHKGVGKMLMLEAEKIAEKENKNKLLVTSGVGVREYYENLGYKLEGPYMSKCF